MKKFSRFNRGFKWILIIVDSFSKKMQTIPLKDKSGPSLARAMETVLRKSKPEYLAVDQGTEFYDQKVKAVLKKYNVKMYSTYTPIKISWTERAIRTLMNRTSRYFTHTKSKKYIDVLPLFTASYNSTVHSTTKFAPNKVNEENSAEVFRNLNALLRIKEKPKYKLGEKVRLLEAKNIFRKGYLPTWKDEVFIVDKVQNTNPPTYIVKDLDGQELPGGYYEYEMQAVVK